MTPESVKRKYIEKLKNLEEDICFYETSNNNELKIAAKSLRGEADEVQIIVDALRKVTEAE